MVVQLVGVKQEQNTAILKAIEKEGAIRRSSEQLQSEY
jgi:molybdenum-dependent DNA-binding transcriptional regulator ModE